MKTSHILTTFLLAGGVAAVISFYLNPKLEQIPATAIADTERASATPNVASLSVEPQQASTARRVATIRSRPDGHYWTRALVNRKSTVEFMVDTGASVAGSPSESGVVGTVSGDGGV